MSIDQVVVHHEIQKCLTEIARGYDDRDWAAVTARLSNDVTADFGEGALNGPDEIIGNVKSYLDRCGPTQHLLGNLIVSSEGDEAESRCYVSDMHLGAGAKSGQTFATLGDYHDRWRKIDGRWLLVNRVKHNRGFVGTLEFFS